MRYPAYVVGWHFHWRFWSPKQCIGGPVRFGWWATVYHVDGHYSEQSRLQVAIKLAVIGRLRH